MCLRNFVQLRWKFLCSLFVEKYLKWVILDTCWKQTRDCHSPSEACLLDDYCHVINHCFLQRAVIITAVLSAILINLASFQLIGIFLFHCTVIFVFLFWYNCSQRRKQLIYVHFAQVCPFLYLIFWNAVIPCIMPSSYYGTCVAPWWFVHQGTIWECPLGMFSLLFYSFYSLTWCQGMVLLSSVGHYCKRQCIVSLHSLHIKFYHVDRLCADRVSVSHLCLMGCFARNWVGWYGSVVI